MSSDSVGNKKQAVERRPMKFPYTFSGKFAQFPWMFYVKNNWVWRYYIFGVLASFPIFSWINKQINSTANTEKYAEMKRKDDEEIQHRLDEL